ncbi:unnamed protein product [Cunninghamella echinulata]
MTQAIIVTAVSARFEKDGELIGKQDPYLQASLDLNVKESYRKTYVAKNSGTEPEWNQTLEFNYNGENEIYVEILDNEKGVDGVIGYTTIPLKNIINSDNAVVNGQFPLFDYKGENTGVVVLVIKARGFENSSDVVPEYTTSGDAYLNEDQQTRAKKIHNKELAGDVASGLAGGK